MAMSPSPNRSTSESIERSAEEYGALHPISAVRIGIDAVEALQELLEKGVGCFSEDWLRGSEDGRRNHCPTGWSDHQDLCPAATKTSDTQAPEL